MSENPFVQVPAAAAILRNPAGGPDAPSPQKSLEERVAAMEATMEKIVAIARTYFRQHFE